MYNAQRSRPRLYNKSRYNSRFDKLTELLNNQTQKRVSTNDFFSNKQIDLRISVVSEYDPSGV